MRFRYALFGQCWCRTALGCRPAEVLGLGRGRAALRSENGRRPDLSHGDPPPRHLDHIWTSTVDTAIAAIRSEAPSAGHLEGLLLGDRRGSRSDGTGPRRRCLTPPTVTGGHRRAHREVRRYRKSTAGSVRPGRARQPSTQEAVGMEHLTGCSWEPNEPGVVSSGAETGSPVLQLGSRVRNGYG